MIQVIIQQASVDAVGAYVERIKLAIFQKMHEGMLEAMQGLAVETVYEASAAGIQNRTGALFTDILNSPTVKETAELITGRVSAKSEMTIGGRKFEGYLGTALDEGFAVPASAEPKIYEFMAADGDSRFTHGHVAFKVAPRPFMHRASESFTAPIMEIIQAKVAEAYL